MSVVLYQLKPMFGLPNPSPFCMKLETYLRMAEIEHQVVAVTNLKGSPTGKAPYIEIDGQAMADSGLIIAHLERTFQIHTVAGLPRAERRLVQGLLRGIDGEPARPLLHDRQAAAVAGDGGAHVHGVHVVDGLDRQALYRLAWRDSGNGAEISDDAGEHS